MNPRHTGKVARLPENFRNQLNEFLDNSLECQRIIEGREELHLLCEDSKTDNQPLQSSPTTDNEPI
jgi:hypothetical protein